MFLVFIGLNPKSQSPTPETDMRNKTEAGLTLNSCGNSHVCSNWSLWLVICFFVFCLSLLVCCLRRLEFVSYLMICLHFFNGCSSTICCQYCFPVGVVIFVPISRLLFLVFVLRVCLQLYALVFKFCFLSLWLLSSPLCSYVYWGLGFSSLGIRVEYFRVLGFRFSDFLFRVWGSMFKV